MIQQSSSSLHPKILQRSTSPKFSENKNFYLQPISSFWTESCFKFCCCGENYVDNVYNFLHVESLTTASLNSRNKQFFYQIENAKMETKWVSNYFADPQFEWSQCRQITSNILSASTKWPNVMRRDNIIIGDGK